MERYFKISELELFTLISAQLKLQALEWAGVDSWDNYREINKLLDSMATEVGLNPEYATFEDVANEYLSDYVEVS